MQNQSINTFILVSNKTRRPKGKSVRKNVEEFNLISQAELTNIQHYTQQTQKHILSKHTKDM